MFVGMCRLTLRMPENASLKDKRQIVQSVIRKLRNKFNVSVAEIDDLDRWQIATIGLSCVSNDASHAREQIENALAFVERERFDAEVIEREIEVTRVLP